MTAPSSDSSVPLSIEAGREAPHTEEVYQMLTEENLFRSDLWRSNHWQCRNAAVAGADLQKPKDSSAPAGTLGVPARKDVAPAEAQAAQDTANNSKRTHIVFGYVDSDGETDTQGSTQSFWRESNSDAEVTTDSLGNSYVGHKFKSECSMCSGSLKTLESSLNSSLKTSGSTGGLSVNGSLKTLGSIGSSAETGLPTHSRWMKVGSPLLKPQVSLPQMPAQSSLMSLPQKFSL